MFSDDTPKILVDDGGIILSSLTQRRTAHGASRLLWGMEKRIIYIIGCLTAGKQGTKVQR